MHVASVVIDRDSAQWNRKHRLPILNLVYSGQFGLFRTIWFIQDNLVYSGQSGLFETIWFIQDNELLLQ